MTNNIFEVFSKSYYFQTCWSQTIFFELLHTKPCRIIWKLPQKFSFRSRHLRKWTNSRTSVMSGPTVDWINYQTYKGNIYKMFRTSTSGRANKKSFGRARYWISYFPDEKNCDYPKIARKELRLLWKSFPAIEILHFLLPGFLLPCRGVYFFFL